MCLVVWERGRNPELAEWMGWWWEVGRRSARFMYGAVQLAHVRLLLRADADACGSVRRLHLQGPEPITGQ